MQKYHMFLFFKVKDLFIILCILKKRKKADI